MFEIDSQPPLPHWPHAEQRPDPYHPGWRRSWFRRHRAQSAAGDQAGQPALFTP